MPDTPSRLLLRRAVLIVAAATLAACAGAPVEPHSTAKRVDAHLTAGDTAAALDILEHANLENDDPALMLRLARLYRAEGSIVGRLESQRILERANQLFPHDPRVLLEMGKTYYAQTFFPDAQRCFHEALELDPTLCEARMHIAQYHYDTWRRVNDYRDDLDLARRGFREALGCDPDNVRAAQQFAYSLYVLRRMDELKQACDEFVKRFPDAPAFPFLLGTIAYEAEDYPRAARWYAAALERLDEDVLARFVQISDIIAITDRDVYEKQPYDQQRLIDRAYWIDTDPDPTTDLNERHLEHIYRTFLTDVYYSVSRPETRGWDTERGETFIKFGAPDSVEYSLGKSSLGGRTEKWLYGEDGVYREIVFVDTRLNGDLMIPFRQGYRLATIRGTSKRTDFTPAFSDVPGAMDVVTFKDDDLSSAMYLFMIVDADSFAGAADLSTADHIYLRTALFDGDWNAQSRTADTLWTTELEDRHDGDGRVYDLVRKVNASFDDYHVAVAFEDENSDALALLKSDASSYRYAGDGVAASDLLLERNDDRGPKVRRHQRVLLPNIFREYSEGERLRVYFEVYDLGVSGGRSVYDVTYAIHPYTGEKPATLWSILGRGVSTLVGREEEPVISQTVRRSGNGHNEHEEIAINIDTLDEGRYELVVTVNDIVSGEKTEVSTLFTKLIGDAQTSKR